MYIGLKDRNFSEGDYSAEPSYIIYSEVFYFDDVSQKTLCKVLFFLRIECRSVTLFRAGLGYNKIGFYKDKG